MTLYSMMEIYNPSGIVIRAPPFLPGIHMGQNPGTSGANVGPLPSPQRVAHAAFAAARFPFPLMSANMLHPTAAAALANVTLQSFAQLPNVTSHQSTSGGVTIMPKDTHKSSLVLNLSKDSTRDRKTEQLGAPSPEKPKSSFSIADILNGTVGRKPESTNPAPPQTHHIRSVSPQYELASLPRKGILLSLPVSKPDSLSTSRSWDEVGSTQSGRSSSPEDGLDDEGEEEEIDVGEEKPKSNGKTQKSPLDALFKMTSKTFEDLDGSRILTVDGDTVDQNGLFSKTPNSKKRRKSRTAFTNQQIYELEKRFLYQKYLTPTDRDEIAQQLGLSNAQVITWFQNRRAKLKRDLEELKADVTAAKVIGKEPQSLLTRIEEMQNYATHPSFLKWDKKQLKAIITSANSAGIGGGCAKLIHPPLGSPHYTTNALKNSSAAIAAANPATRTLLRVDNDTPASAAAKYANEDQSGSEEEPDTAIDLSEDRASYTSHDNSMDYSTESETDGCSSNKTRGYNNVDTREDSQSDSLLTGSAVETMLGKHCENENKVTGTKREGNNDSDFHLNSKRVKINNSVNKPPVHNDIGSNAKEIIIEKNDSNSQNENRNNVYSDIDSDCENIDITGESYH